ncbi:MAG: GntR family transcriptional regulator [Firmicutes bacterium]|nr:GntR family transcriptional regulator [Bacillota bacterium]
MLKVGGSGLHNNGILLHQQVTHWILRKIEDGTWPPHSQIGSEPDLAKELGVSRGTLQKAINTLVEERRLYRIRGKGTYVSAKILEEPLAQNLLSLSEALELQGLQIATEVIAQKVAVESPPWVQKSLSLESDEPSLYLQRIKKVPDGPLALLDNYVRSEMLPGIQNLDFSKRRLFDIIERDYGFLILWGSRVFDVAMATPELVKKLAVAKSAPLLYLEQVSYVTGNVPVECSRVWIRPDRMRLKSIITRDHTR